MMKKEDFCIAVSELDKTALLNREEAFAVVYIDKKNGKIEVIEWDAEECEGDMIKLPTIDELVVEVII